MQQKMESRKRLQNDCNWGAFRARAQRGPEKLPDNRARSSSVARVFGFVCGPGCSRYLALMFAAFCGACAAPQGRGVEGPPPGTSAQSAAPTPQPALSEGATGELPESSCETAYVSDFDVREPLVGHDSAATAKASNALRHKLRALAKAPRFALGHEDSTAYGVGWNGKEDYSDVKAVCGSHVAVFGWDIFGIENGDAHNGDGVYFESMRQHIASAYADGAIITISWHLHNPVTQGNAWETTSAVEHILPGRSRHADYVRYLDRAANFLQSLRGPKGELIPVIFRPFHEHTGNWFWWGKAHVSEADYRALWRFSVDYLRKSRGLGHLLFAFSPNGFDARTEETYFYGYPGDDYVDVLGFDHYYRDDGSLLVQLSELVVRLANVRGKVAAITEFGVHGGLNHPSVGPNWIIRRFLDPLAASPTALGVAYALAWRNAREDHCYLPYPGHAGAEALARFCRDSRVVLLQDSSQFE